MSTNAKLAPVFYTIAQIQFNPIEQMDTYIPKMQEHLRRDGYPDFQPNEKLRLLTVRHADNESKAAIQEQLHKQWSFNNMECTEGYILRSNTLVFHTTHYETFSSFLEKLFKGLNLVHEIVELAYIERVGLRYLNAISAEAESTLDDYLNPRLQGLSDIAGEILSHHLVETVAQVDQGTLIARSLIVENKLPIPPDLYPLQLKLSEQFTNLRGKIAVLDTDYFVSQQRFKIDPDKIREQLQKSHGIMTKIFHASVTKNALAGWGIEV